MSGSALTSPSPVTHTVPRPRSRAPGHAADRRPAAKAIDGHVPVVLACRRSLGLLASCPGTCARSANGDPIRLVGFFINMPGPIGPTPADKRRLDGVPNDLEIGLARPEPDPRDDWRPRHSPRPDAGREAPKLAYTCHGCHGIENYKNAFPVYSVPKLGGQHAAYMVVALKATRTQDRPHATMHAQAATLSDQDMRTSRRFSRAGRLKSRGSRSARRRRPARPASPATAMTASASCRSIRTSSGQHRGLPRHLAAGLQERPAQERDHGRHGGGAHRARHRELAKYYVGSGRASARPTTSQAREVHWARRE